MREIAMNKKKRKPDSDQLQAQAIDDNFACRLAHALLERRILRQENRLLKITIFVSALAIGMITAIIAAGNVINQYRPAEHERPTSFVAEKHSAIFAGGSSFVPHQDSPAWK